MSGGDLCRHEVGFVLVRLVWRERVLAAGEFYRKLVEFSKNPQMPS